MHFNTLKLCCVRESSKRDTPAGSPCPCRGVMARWGKKSEGSSTTQTSAKQKLAREKQDRCLLSSGVCFFSGHCQSCLILRPSIHPFYTACTEAYLSIFGRRRRNSKLIDEKKVLVARITIQSERLSLQKDRPAATSQVSQVKTMKAQNCRS